MTAVTLSKVPQTLCHAWCTAVHTADPGDAACLSEGRQVPLSLHTMQVPAPGPARTRTVCSEIGTVVEAEPGQEPVIVLDLYDANHRKLTPEDAMRVAANLALDAMTAMGGRS